MSYMSTKKAAQYADVHPQTIRNTAASARSRGISIRGDTRIFRAEISSNEPEIAGYDRRKG